MFFINTVIGHLWHGIPGAYYQRMFGEPLTPYRYGLIEQTADHYHWNTERPGRFADRPGADALGGGHAHSGLMIYQGTTGPKSFNGIFRFELSRAPHQSRSARTRGSGYVGKHGQDVVKFGDPWFRGIDLDYGPDGGVFVLDWSDTGECHATPGASRNGADIQVDLW